MGKIELSTSQLAHVRAVSQGIDWKMSAERYLAPSDPASIEAAHIGVLRFASYLLRHAYAERREQLDLDWSDLDPRTAQLENEEWQSRFDDYMAKYGDDFGEDELLENFLSEDPLAKSLLARQERRRKSIDTWLADLERIHISIDIGHRDFRLFVGADLAPRFAEIGVVSLADARYIFAHTDDWRRSLKWVNPTQVESIRLMVAFIYAHHDDAKINAPSPLLVASVDVIKSNALEISAWLSSRTLAPATLRYLKREIHRFASWLDVTREGTTLLKSTPNDCQVFKGLLAYRGTGRFDSNRFLAQGALSSSSRRQSEKAIQMFYGWCVETRRIAASPWPKDGPVIRTKNGDAKQRTTLERLAHLALLGKTEDVLRCAAVMSLEHAGLKITDILSARIGDLKKSSSENFQEPVSVLGCYLDEVACKHVASYLTFRGVWNQQEHTLSWPLISSLGDASKSVRYQALRESMLRTYKQVEKRLAEVEKARALRAVKALQRKMQRAKQKLRTGVIRPAA